MTNQTYTPDMVTGDMIISVKPYLGTSERVHCIGYNGNVAVFSFAEIIAAAINASPLWAEVQQLREQLRLAASTEDQQNETILHLQTAKRELVEALEKINGMVCYASEEDPTKREEILLMVGSSAREALAKHGCGHE